MERVRDRPAGKGVRLRARVAFIKAKSERARELTLH